MSRTSRNRTETRRAAALGVGVSVAVHLAAFALVDVRIPVGSTDEDVVRLASSLPAPPARNEQEDVRQERQDELRLMQLAASDAQGADAAPEPAASSAPELRFDGSARPVPVAAAARERTATYEPVAVVHPASRTTSTSAARTGAVAFSALAAPATRTGSAAPPVHDGGDVGDAKQRWAEAAGVGARGAGLFVGVGGGGACGIPGRGPVTSWF